MIKPRPPHKSARECRRLAKAVNSVGIDFGAAAIGVDHDLIRPISAGIARLSAALQEMGEDLERRALTPPPEPPPAPKPTPILDYLERKEAAEAPPPPAEVVPEVPKLRPFVAFVGGNALFWLSALGPGDAALDAAGFLPCEAFRFEPVEMDFIRARNLPTVGQFFEARKARLDDLAALADAENRWRPDAPDPEPRPIEAIRADEAHPKVPAEPKAKRPKPAAKPEPGDKLGKRQCWMAMVAGMWAFRIYRATEEQAAAQLAQAGISRDTWPEARLALEFTNESHHHNDVPALTDLTPEQARQRVRNLLAEYEASIGSGFVAPMPEGDDDQPPARTFLATHRWTQMPLFTVAATDLAEAEDVAAMGLGRREFEALSIAELPEGESVGSLPDFETFDPEDMPAVDTPPTSPDAMSGPPEPMSGPADPEVRTYPTEGPRDPLATLPVEELGLRKRTLDGIKAEGIELAAQLEEELDGSVLDHALPLDEDVEYVREKIREWEKARVKRIVADGTWLDEELTYAAFREADAAFYWNLCRERGLSDDELRNAINKLFPKRVCGGWGQHFRAGHYFEPGNAPAFYLGGAKPKRGQEPALEGKPLVDAVRRLLAIPTREEPAKGGGKAAKAPKRKAVANG